MYNFIYFNIFFSKHKFMLNYYFILINKYFITRSNGNIVWIFCVFLNKMSESDVRHRCFEVNCVIKCEKNQRRNIRICVFGFPAPIKSIVGVINIRCWIRELCQPLPKGHDLRLPYNIPPYRSFKVYLKTWTWRVSSSRASMTIVNNCKL